MILPISVAGCHPFREYMPLEYMATCGRHLCPGWTKTYSLSPFLGSTGGICSLTLIHFISLTFLLYYTNARTLYYYGCIRGDSKVLLAMRIDVLVLDASGAAPNPLFIAMRIDLL